MTLSDTKRVFVIREKVKQTRVGYHINLIIFKAYPSEPALCVISYLKKYLNRTTSLRKPNRKQLLISFAKPHNAVAKENVSRWCKTVVRLADIDTKKFGTHSIRAASTSCAARKVGDITRVLESVGWSNATTFQTFYNKPVSNSFNLGSTLLHGIEKKIKRQTRMLSAPFYC